FEAEVKLRLEVLPAVGAAAATGTAPAAPTTAPEQAAEDVADVADVFEAEPARAAGTAAGEAGRGGPEAAHLVVLLAPLGVADHVVGGGDLLEPLLGGGVAGVGVGVVLAGQLPVRALDLLGGGRLRHAEDPVVV